MRTKGCRLCGGCIRRAGDFVGCNEAESSGSIMRRISVLIAGFHTKLRNNNQVLELVGNFRRVQLESIMKISIAAHSSIEEVGVYC